jgi:hypothetical protein
MNQTKEVTLYTLLHATVVSLLVLLFLWPAGSAEPKDLPIGLVGPSAQTSQIAAAIEQQQPGALKITSFETRSEAEQAIAQKQIYGALILGPQPEALVASAANPSVANLITEIGDGLIKMSAAQQGMPMPSLSVSDVAGLPESDPRGAVFGSSSLPLVIGGISLGAIAILRLKSGGRRMALVASASLATGFVAAALVGGVFGALPGDYLANSLAFAAVIAAIGYSLVGAHALIGMAGFGLMAATLFLLGNPLNGVNLPMEFYAEPWGQVGQLMPVGAGFELLRKINFFEAADQAAQWWVLAVWILLGFSLSMLALRKRV